MRHLTIIYKLHIGNIFYIQTFMNVSKDVISRFNIVLYSVQQVCTPHMGLTKEYHITSACRTDTGESILIY